MAKYYGVIGFCTMSETSPGVHTDQVVERHYYGDIIQNIRNIQTPSDKLNDDININNKISIVADAFAYENFHAIKYISFMDSNWKISGIEVQHPRLILTIGGVYNGDTA